MDTRHLWYSQKFCHWLVLSWRIALHYGSVWCTPCNIFGVGVYYIFYSIFIILSKFQKLFFCVTVNQQFYVFDIVIALSFIFLNPTLVAICIRTNYWHCLVIFFLLLTRHIFLKKPISCIMAVRKLQRYKDTRIQSKQKWLVVIFCMKIYWCFLIFVLFSLSWPEIWHYFYSERTRLQGNIK